MDSTLAKFVEAVSQSRYHLFTSRYSPPPVGRRGCQFHWWFASKEEAVSAGESLRCDRDSEIEAWWITDTFSPSHEVVQRSEEYLGVKQ